MKSGHKRYRWQGLLASILASAVVALSGVASGAEGILTARATAQQVRTGRNNLRGTLKLCSKPMVCSVRVAGQILQKNKPVLTVDNLKPGVYEIVFESEGGTLIKRARVGQGQTTVLFASLDTPGQDGVGRSDLLREQPIEPSAVYQMKTPVAENALGTAWNEAAGKPGRIAALGVTGAAERPADLVNAQITFELAGLLQREFNPFTASRRYERALELYRHIIEDFPDSPYVELAHYNSGRIFESFHLKRYGQALVEYQTVLRLYPNTVTDAAERVAKLYGGAIENQAQAQLATIRPLEPISPAEVDAANEANYSQSLAASAGSENTSSSGMGRSLW